MKKFTFIKELRSFLLLWSSQAVSGLGTAMTTYALTIWTYEQQGTASSLMLLTLCTFLPTILFRFIAGALADRLNKKRIMLLSDLFAAFGTLAVLMLYAFSALEMWHLYLINVLLSFMNAFQSPASFAATSLLVPKKHYTRVGGLQGFSNSAVSILAPALGSLLVAFGGLKLVLLCDLASFAVAFCVLLFFVRIPEVKHESDRQEEPFFRSCIEGFLYLRSHTALLRLTLFFAIINFLAKLGNDGLLSPFVLGRSGNDQQALGLVQSATAFGALAGSIIVTGMNPAKHKMRVIFVATACIFAGNIVQSLSTSVWVWSVGAFATYAVAVVMNANLTTVMREHIPLELHGRVFSARDTLQNCTIPLALFLGGILADHVMNPFMQTESPLQRIASQLFGADTGSGIAVMFFCVGILGAFISLTRLFKPIYRELDQ